MFEIIIRNNFLGINFYKHFTSSISFVFSMNTKNMLYVSHSLYIIAHNLSDESYHNVCPYHHILYSDSTNSRIQNATSTNYMLAGCNRFALYKSGDCAREAHTHTHTHITAITLSTPIAILKSHDDYRFSGSFSSNKQNLTRCI